MALLALLGNFQWQRWISFVVLACAVLAYRKLEDIPGNTRQFISKINHDCRDFKGVLSRCHVWKDMGFCFKYRRQMQHVCNRTCQYCVPGQKQWQVIDIKGVWGQVRTPSIAHSMSSAVQPKEPAVQILGKERAPQVDDAASAIATQLEDGIDHGISASPKVISQLNKFHIGLQHALAPTETKATTSDEAKGKLSASQPDPPTDQGEHKPPPTNGPSISGITQVSAQSKEGHPVVVLMGYELGEKSSQRVNDVLKKTDSFQRTDPEATNNVGPQGRFTNNRLLALGENSIPYVKTAQERNTTSRIPSEENVSESDLQEISTLLDNAASSSEGLRNNQYMHEETNERNADTNALQFKTDAPSLDTQAINTLQNNVTHDEGTGNPDPVLPVSSDETVNQQSFNQLTMHAQQETPVINTTSMADTELKPHSLEGMPSDISGMANKHANINSPVLQMNRPLPKHSLPGSSGKQVTLTINEKPGTGEAVFKVQNSPHTTGLSYETEGNSENLLPSSYRLRTESEEARAKSDEEETKIREATNAIKNVIKLFGQDNRRGRTRLIQQPTQDFRGDSKSLEAGDELSEYEAQVAQAQNQDRAKASAQALSQQSGQELSPNEVEPGLRPPNYAVVSTSDSKEWKSLAHVLATQLKRVLNHMESREMENRYEKEKIQEEMLLMAQQQMMGRDEDEGPDNENDEDDEDEDEMNNREKRRHSVLNPQVKERSENSSKNRKVIDKKFYKTNPSRKLTEHNLVHRAVKKLSRFEKLHKSKKPKRRLINDRNR